MTCSRGDARRRPHCASHISLCGASLGTRVGDRRGAGGAYAHVARQRDGGGHRGERTRATARRAPVRAVRWEVVAAEVCRGLAGTSGYRIDTIESNMPSPKTSNCQTYISLKSE